MKNLDWSDLEAASGGLALNQLGGLNAPAPGTSPFDPNAQTPPFGSSFGQPTLGGGGVDPFGALAGPYGHAAGGFDPSCASPQAIQGCGPVDLSGCAPCAPCEPQIVAQGGFDPFGISGISGIAPSAAGPVAAGSAPVADLGTIAPPTASVSANDPWANPFGSTPSSAPFISSPGGTTPISSGGMTPPAFAGNDPFAVTK